MSEILVLSSSDCTSHLEQPAGRRGSGGVGVVRGYA